MKTPSPHPTLSQATTNHAVARIEKELLLAPSPSENDAGLASALPRNQYLLRNGNIDTKIYTKAITDIMRALKWRLRIQESFYLAFEGLTETGLVDAHMALDANKPIPWDSWPEWLTKLVSILRCFSLADECGSSGPEGRYLGHFDAPLVWLAWIIGREGGEIGDVVDYLGRTRVLGRVDGERLESKTWVFGGGFGAGESEGEVVLGVKVPQIGFWLPQDAGNMGDFWNDWHTRYHQFRLVYDECFGVGAWGEYESFAEVVAKWR